MKRNFLVCIGCLALALTASAQTPYNYRKAPQRTTAGTAYRGTSAVDRMPAQRTFSNARYRQPAFPSARFREPMPRTTRMQPRMNSSSANRPAMTNSAAWRRGPMPPTNDWRESGFSPRPRPSDSFVNRPAGSDLAARQQARLATRNKWADSDFRERLRNNSSLLNRSPRSDAVDRRQTHQSFNNYWANSNSRNRLHTNNSFVNRSRSTAFWNGTRAGFTHNWKGAAFAGKQYSAFRNYQSQWHDSGWWDGHCGDRIVFITVYSQPFPFFFDAGYWYPCWGYYPDSYYPYDGPIYGYNGLSPDQVIANVQTELYNEGYYDGPIDGILGADTQAAIANYQADHGLAVTAAIDEPTVVSLGVA
jgi:Putative peptidoglycan binding domain